VFRTADRGTESDVSSSKALEAILSQMPFEDTASGGAPGRFSFLEFMSGAGGISTSIAQQFPQATVISVEPSNRLAKAHLAAVNRRNVSNAAVCSRSVDARLMKSLYKSPEMLRYMSVSANVVDLIAERGR